jgi:type 1 glutamine amidotransferase
VFQRSRAVAVLTAILFSQVADAANTPRRVLLVTHAGGFMHDSLLTAEQVLKALGPDAGFALTCYRFTAEPDRPITVRRTAEGKPTNEGGKEIETTALDDYSYRFERLMGEPVTREACGRVNAATLKQFDAVMFFTTSTWVADRGSHPLTAGELDELIAWVEQGGAFVGVHCASDTLHNTPYGDLLGGTFGGHPWIHNVRLHVEDPQHPAARGLTDGAEIYDEIYQFGPKSSDVRVPMRVQPYSRERLHVITSIDNRTIDVTKGARADGDYPVAWCHTVGKGRSFYTSLGHHREVWRDVRFQQHLLGGLDWAVGRADGDASPSGEKPK